MGMHTLRHDDATYFADDVETVKAAAVRPQVHLTEVPAPRRIAPHAVAFSAEVVDPKNADDVLIARCGVTSPGPTSDACFSANDVDWVQISVSGGTRYVTYGREPAIEVLVPSSANLDGTLFLNEINTLPGFTPVSMFPAVWRESGLDYTDLITDLIELARERKTGLR